MPPQLFDRSPKDEKTDDDDDNELAEDAVKELEGQWQCRRGSGAGISLVKETKQEESILMAEIWDDNSQA